MTKIFLVKEKDIKINKDGMLEFSVFDVPKSQILTPEEIDGALEEWDFFKRKIAFHEARLIENQQTISKWVKERYPNLWSILKKLEEVK